MTQLKTVAGDGALDIEVSSTGAFGSNTYGVALYDPLGTIEAASTTFQSDIAFRIGQSGTRQFISDLVTNPIIISSTKATTSSSFIVSNLKFQLLQEVADLTNFGQRTGSSLSQTYNITNPTNQAINFELVRYFDGDLEFDGSLRDTGGKITRNGRDILFETDSGDTANTPTTFVGITANGGTAISSNRLEIGQYGYVRGKILDGDPLSDLIEGDTNGNGFVDSYPYDLAPALRNIFTLAPGQSTTYITETLFGSGEPARVVLPKTVTISKGLDGAEPSTNGSFILTRTGDVAAALTVNLDVPTGTATNGTDYKTLPTTVTFAAGSASATVNVIPISDTLVEGTETIGLALKNGTGYNLGSTVNASINLIDQIPLPSSVPIITDKNTRYEYLSKDTAYGKSWKIGDAVINGYKVEKIFDDSNGFFALGLVSTTTGEPPILVIRGTDPSISDLLADSDPNGIGFKQFSSKKVEVTNWILTKAKVDITGHSLGGAIAQAFAAELTKDNRIIGDVVTFNSPGISTAEANKFNPANAGSVTHYIVTGDVVSLAGEKFISGNYKLASYQGSPNDPKGLIDNHLNPILTDRVEYNGNELVKNPGEVKNKLVTTTISNSSSTDYLNSPFFTYLDSKYLTIVSELTAASALIPGVPQLAPALLFRSTLEPVRKTIGAVLQIPSLVPQSSVSFNPPNFDFAKNGVSLLGSLTTTQVSSDLKVTYSANPEPELKIQGQAEFKPLWNAKVDFTGSNYISYTKNGWNVSGSISAKDISLPGGFGLKDIKISRDGIKDILKGQVEIAIPNIGGGTRGVGGTIGFQSGKLDSIALSGSNLNIPTSIPLLLLQDIGAGINNIAQVNSPTELVNLEIQGNAKFTGGPQQTIGSVPYFLPNGINNAALLTIKGDIRLNKDSLTANAALTIFDSNFLTGNGKIIANFNTKSLTGSADLSLFNGFATATTKFATNSSFDITMRGDAQVNAPSGLNVITDLSKGFKGGFGVGFGSNSLRGTFLLDYTNDSNSSNDKVAAWTTIDTFFGAKAFGTSVSFDGKVSTIGADNIPRSNTAFAPLSATLIADTSNSSTSILSPPSSSTTFRQPSPSSIVTPSTQLGGFAISKPTEWILLNAGWDNAANNPAIQVITPTGKIIRESEFAANNIAVVDKMTTSTSKTVMVLNPVVGNWNAQLVNPTGLGNVEYSALQSTPTATIKVIDPATDVSSQKVVINYNAVDPNPNARVSLFYDTDNQGFDGIAIKKNLSLTSNSGSYNWDTQGIATGDYYIYAMVTDDKGIPAFSYSQGKVRITESADLSITSSIVNNTPISAGTNLTYKLTVTNQGPSTAKGVALTDALSTGVNFVSASIPNQGTGSSVKFDLGDIPSGTSKTVTMIVNPSQAGKITNIASVTAKTFDSQAVNDQSVLTTDINPSVGGTPTPAILPTVSVIATTPNAAETKLGEIAKPGLFTITRTGDLTKDLIISYGIGGTAINGTDYAGVVTNITIKAGSSTAKIQLDIIDDTLIENAETAVFTLSNNAAYIVDPAKSTATVSITDNDVNIPTPTKSLVSVLNRGISNTVDEIGVFGADDANGTINGISVGQSGYISAALARAQVLSSNLSGEFFDSVTSQRQLNNDESTRYTQIYRIKDSTADQMRVDLFNGKNPQNIEFGNSENQGANNPVKVTTNTADNNRGTLTWNGLVLDVQNFSTPIAPVVGTALQGKSEGEVIDLRNSGLGNVFLTATTKSSAAYDNHVGFYTVDDATGKIGNLKPSDVGYAAAALNRAVGNMGKTDAKDTQVSQAIYAPYLIANGTIGQFLSQNANNSAGDLPHAYFNYIGANPDKIDHVRLLGDNKFGFEDMYGGGDRDFNDVVLQVKIRA